MAFVAGIYFWSEGLKLLAAGLLMLGVGLLSVWNMPDIVARRWYRRTDPQSRELRYTVMRTGMIITTGEGTRQYPWKVLDGFFEAQDCFLLWLDTRHFLIIPKRAFQGTDLGAVRRYMLEGIPPRSQSYGAHLRLVAFWGLAAAFVLAVLFLGRA
jgi:hypothetical protein